MITMTSILRLGRAFALHLDRRAGCDPAGRRRRGLGPGGSHRAVLQALCSQKASLQSGWLGGGVARVPSALTAAVLGFLALASVVPARAQDSTPYSMGGVTTKFAPKVRAADRSGKLFRITGHCQSACTMFLAVRKVCIEPSAQLLFHAAKTPRGTRDMMGSYNSRLRAYLVANRIMESPTFHTISGRDMIARFGYRRCP
jgi:hypothetical protein